jgi:succinate dehydrogenase/fumarate reductase cytochrome b subunit
MTDRKLQQAQAISGALFGAFLLFHLVNTAIAVRGAEVYDGVQNQLRAVYQVPIIELGLVLAPLLAHMGLALTSMWRRRGKSLPTPGWPARLHRWSGRFLLIFVLGHVGATRLPALLADAPPRFAGVAFTFQWIPLYFWPYYPLLALAGWYHFLFGLGTALPQLGLRSAGKLLSPRTLAVTFALGAVALLAGIVTFGTADASVRESPFAKFLLSL